MSSPNKRRCDIYSDDLNYRNDRPRSYDNHNSKQRRTGGHSFLNTADKQNPGPECKRTEIIRDGRKFPVFQKPSVIGVFSVDAERKVQPDERQIKYLYWNNKESTCTQVNFDLNEGIHCCVRKDELLYEKLDHIFYWIKSEGSQRDECSKADFVCFRGLLTAVMSTPYEQKEGWIISATQWNNTIYLCAFDTEQRKRERANTTDKQKRFQSWGYKFEQFMLAEEPGQEPDTSLPVIETEEFACVFRSKLNSHSIVYAAEMDGVQSEKPVDAATLKANSVPFIELKTSRHIETQRQDQNFKRTRNLIHDHGTRGAYKLDVPRCRLALTQKSFPIAAVNMFNILPDYVRNLKIEEFKEYVKGRLVESPIYSLQEIHSDFFACPPPLFKLLKWWCQSFLVGIETIFCGFRDDDGIVSSVKKYKVRELPKMAKGLWDPCVCMNFCAQFLDFVKTCIQESPNSNAHWKFEWTPGNSIMGQEIGTDSEFSFVPEWFSAE